MDLSLGSKAATDADAPPFCRVLSPELVIDGSVVRHPEERSLKEAIRLLRQARHVEILDV